MREGNKSTGWLLIRQSDSAAEDFLDRIATGNDGNDMGFFPSKMRVDRGESFSGRKATFGARNGFASDIPSWKLMRVRSKGGIL